MDPLLTPMWMNTDRPLPPAEPAMTPWQMVKVACLCAVFLLIGFFGCVFLGNAQLEQALTENADLRAAYALPERSPSPKPAPAKYNF